ncbi:hypothetical protein BAUCODRAFT_149406 [Baudoinia panamericana UAMH 10762]|uniref:Uncharacterized protein n=1 Tax=Baudoinia panamericana (strain UAMH 10762) TaxID=717646 RepID=M2N8L2_BAUPA|nr:uncharacterized protein BAUCODRAFT_149406 [Baudoinia panamericana UAMH 10762]EMC95434.1 hypothetical protein BAUCODRAFT_149406 [Baudoinia panamericana UAMH 10762]
MASQSRSKNAAQHPVAGSSTSLNAMHGSVNGADDDDSEPVAKPAIDGSIEIESPKISAMFDRYYKDIDPREAGRVIAKK